MKLENEDRTRLEKMLEEAFPSYTALERMVQHQLGKNLESIAGTGPLQDVIYRLVHKWAVPKGQEQQLVQGAFRESSGNPTVYQFMLFCLITQMDLDHENIVEAFQKSLPTKRKIEKLPTSLHEMIFILDDSLEPAYIHGKVPLFLFASFIAKLSGGEVNSHSIKEWLETVAKSCHYIITAEDINSYFQSQYTPAPYKDVPTYFLIEVKNDTLSPKGMSECTIRMFYWISGEKCEQINLEGQDKDGYLILHFDEIRNKILPELKSIVKRRKISIKNIMIDVFLPYHLLAEAVDQWKGKLDDEELHLGRYFFVCVRSLDRAENELLRNMCKIKWDKRHEQNGIVFDDISSNVPIQSLHDFLFNSAEEVSIGLPRLPQDQQDRITLFRKMIYGGIPIALWPRSLAQGGYPPDIESKINHLIRNSRVAELRGKVQQIRCEPESLSNECHCGRYLALLWDDADHFLPIDPF